LQTRLCQHVTACQHWQEQELFQMKRNIQVVYCKALTQKAHMHRLPLGRL